MTGEGVKRTNRVNQLRAVRSRHGVSEPSGKVATTPAGPPRTTPRGPAVGPVPPSPTATADIGLSGLMAVAQVLDVFRYQKRTLGSEFVCLGCNDALMIGSSGKEWTLANITNECMQHFTDCDSAGLLAQARIITFGL